MSDSEQERLLLALTSDFTSAEDLSEDDRAMLTYAVKLTRTPAEVDEADIEVLRERGFGDRAIHDLCAVTAYFAFVNRIADGLGVELET